MNIFIGGSAREEIDEKYKIEAEKLGKLLSKTEHKIYCCASTFGVIGKIYSQIDKNKVRTAVPKAHLGYDDIDKERITVITETINERTDYLLKNSDVCIFLPGRIGTIYEIMSSIETKRAHEHNCKIIIVNLFGYFDELIKMFDKTYKENFASIKDKNTYTIINKIEELDLINLK